MLLPARLRNALIGLSGFVGISFLILLALSNNPYYTPPVQLPKALTIPFFRHHSAAEDYAELDSDYYEAPDTVHKHFTGVDPEHQEWQELNYRTLRDLHACLALGTCAKNQNKFVLFVGYWVTDALVSLVGWYSGRKGGAVLVMQPCSCNVPLAARSLSRFRYWEDKASRSSDESAKNRSSFH